MNIVFTFIYYRAAKIIIFHINSKFTHTFFTQTLPFSLKLNNPVLFLPLFLLHPVLSFCPNTSKHVTIDTLDTTPHHLIDPANRTPINALYQLKNTILFHYEVSHFKATIKPVLHLQECNTNIPFTRLFIIFHIININLITFFTHFILKTFIFVAKIQYYTSLYNCIFLFHRSMRH